MIRVKKNVIIKDFALSLVDLDLNNNAFNLKRVFVLTFWDDNLMSSLYLNEMLITIKSDYDCRWEH